MNTHDNRNPYHSPSPTPIAEPVRRRTRWRIAVVTLLLICGVIGLVGVLAQLVAVHSRPVEFGGGLTIMRVFGMSLHATGSILWIASSISCWRGRWLLTCAGVALGILAVYGGNWADLNP